MSEVLVTQTTHDARVLRLTLNAPKGNVLDGEMMEALAGELDRLRQDRRVKLLLFSGTGDHFSFGASVPEHTREQAGKMLKRFHGLFRALAELAIPSAAVVSGQCLGGGLELALMCNFLFADRSARLGQPEINLGVFAPPASLILPLKIGQARADEMLLSGRILKGAEAAEAGLVTRLYEDGESMEAGLEEWIGRFILPKSASSLKHAVRAARWQFNEVLRGQLERIERYYIYELMSSHDANEGIAAFLEKRTPRWESE